MFRQSFLTVLAMSLVVITGCGTFLTLATGSPPTLYGGTSADAGIIANYTRISLGWEETDPRVIGPQGPFGRTVVITLALADLPFSLAGDTLTLSYVFACQLVDKAIGDYYFRDHDATRDARSTWDAEK